MHSLKQHGEMVTGVILGMTVSWSMKSCAVRRLWKSSTVFAKMASDRLGGWSGMLRVSWQLWGIAGDRMVSLSLRKSASVSSSGTASLSVFRHFARHSQAPEILPLRGDRPADGVRRGAPSSENCGFPTLKIDHLLNFSIYQNKNQNMLMIENQSHFQDETS